MASKSKMIDLGSKPEKSKPSEPAKDPTYYPGFSIGSDEEIAFPKGPFHASVKMHMKRSESSEDERGKKRHTYHMELHGVHPEFESLKEEAKESDTDEMAEDAASALLKSMGRARGKKAVEATDEE